MICKNCPNLKPVDGGYYECTLFVDKDGNQLLSKYSLQNKVMMLSKPHYCEVDENGKEKNDEV